MKKKIYSSIFLTAFGATILVSIITLYAFYDFFLNQSKEQLKINCLIIKDSMNIIGENNDYLKTLKESDKDIRLTLVSPDGTVIFDSRSNYQQMQNHISREEIVEAKENGFGEAIRRSETVGKDTIYYSFLLSDGYILRCGRDLDNITSVFLNILPLILGITIALFIISMFIANIMTKKLMKPVENAINKVEENSDNIIFDESYDELQPFLNKLSEQKLKIKQQIQSLYRERDTIKTITDNMQEGLIIINTGQKILSANNSAVELLNGSKAFSYTGKPIISLITEDKLLQKIDNVLLDGERLDININQQNRECRLFVNPVYENKIISGAIIIILDITEVYKVEKMRREFSANVSHELKTPLTSISGFAEMIESGIVTNQEDVVKFASNIHKEATRLFSLIEDIIRLTEIEEGTQTELEEIDLVKVCHESVEHLGYIAQQKGVSLHVQGESGLINANKYMIYELVDNLIDNAIKYNKQGGNVEISVINNEKSVVLKVRDTGIGIEKKHLERIFERFYRVDKSRSKQNGGTGLGLSIVKHIAGYHNAKINIESEVQIGTTITIEF